MIDLETRHLRMVRDILSACLAGYEIRAFGSRVNNKAKPHADLDLVIMSRSPLEPRVMASARDAFSESDLPFKVDLLDWSRLDPAFQALIERNAERVH